MAKNPNYLTEFGESQLPKKITNKKKERGAPLQETNQSAGANNWVEEGYDPHHHVRRFPDGSQMVHAWGKNPRTTFFHSSGFQMNIFPDGTVTMVTTGNKNEYNKAGVTSTNEGHVDTRGGGHTRHNYEGGFYQDVAGDSASHTAGNQASHVAGDSTTNVSGNMNIKGNKQLSIGTQDDGGKLAMSIDMNNGRIQIKSKGDIEVASASGGIKFSGENITMKAKNTLAMNAGGQISSSSPVIATAANLYKTAPGTGQETSLAAEKGVHDGTASQRTAFNYTNTLNNSEG